MLETNPPATLDIGRVIRRTLDVLGKHPALFFGITALFYLPIVGMKLGIAHSLDAFVNSTVEATQLAEPGLSAFKSVFLKVASSATLIWLISLVLTPLSQAAIIHGVFRSFKGEATSFGACVETALSRWLPVLLTSLLVGALTMVGFTMCYLPGVLATVIFYVAIPATVVEGVPANKALQRSDWLTRGSRWQILLLFILITGLSAVLNAATGRIPGLGSQALPMVWSLLSSLVTIVTTTVGSVMGVVVYHDLRLLKDEDTESDELLAVFD